MNKIVKIYVLLSAVIFSSSLFAQTDIIFKDDVNSLIRFIDEGTFASIQLKNGTPATDTDKKIYSVNGKLYYNGSPVDAASTDNDWTIDNNDMFSNASGNVGVNNSSPNFTLDVGGDLNFSGKIYVNGQTGTNGQVLTSGGPTFPPQWKSVEEEPPSFIAYLNQNLDLPGGEGTLNDFDETYDNGNVYDPATGTFTAPSDGLYHFDCKIGYTATTVPLNNKITSLTAKIDNIVATSGTLIKRIWTETNKGESVMFSLNLELAKDEKVTFYVKYPTGSGLAVASQTNFSVGEATTISGFKI